MMFSRPLLLLLYSGGCLYRRICIAGGTWTAESLGSWLASAIGLGGLQVVTDAPSSVGDI